MKNPRAIVLFATFLLSTLGASEARSVCLDSNDPTLTKYYYPTLEQEMESTEAVIVGTVEKVVGLTEDESDPEGYTAFLYTVRVTETIHGKIPAEVILRADNDSGAYRVEEGESHLFFLKMKGEYFSADPCGNSAEMPRAAAVIDELKAILSE